jgi:hypothetical protein
MAMLVLTRSLVRSKPVIANQPDLAGEIA